MTTRAEVIDMGSTDAPNALDEQMVHSVLSAEILQQIATAKRFPRSIAVFRRNLQAQASTDESVARQCHYAIPRDGKTIEGPSIRFAEMVLQAWGNARAATRIVAELDRFVVAQGVFIDLENNIQIGEEVQRRIVGSNGNRFGVDMIGVTGAAARSIALRNAILRGVPKALWWDGYVAARRTIVGDMKTMKVRREDALAYFRSLGVVDAQVFATLGIAGHADIGAEQLMALAGFRTSIEDEGKDPEHLFPPAATNARRTTAPPAAPNPDGAPADPTPPTPGQNGAPADPTPSKQESPPDAGPTSPGSDARPSGAPPAVNAPVETPATLTTFTFADIAAARLWAFAARQTLEGLASAAEVKAHRETADFKARLDALYDLDNDAAMGVLALAQDLIDSFSTEARR